MAVPSKFTPLIARGVARAVAVPARPVILAFMDVVETAYVAPEFPAMSPEKLERTGALVNVCVPAHVLEVVVPKARESVPDVVIVPPSMGYVVAIDVTVPEPPPPPTHVPPIEKQPAARLMPLPNVEVAVAEMLIVFAPVLPRESNVPGVVVPMPMLPDVARKIEEVAASVFVPL